MGKKRWLTWECWKSAGKIKIMRIDREIEYKE